MRFLISVFTASLLFVSGFAFVSARASAQRADAYGTGKTTSATCPQLSQRMLRGARDSGTNPTGQVTELQKFLAGYYKIDPQEIATGYFGRITRGYVIKFQKEQGLPSFGIAGQLKRAVIAKVCSQTPTTTQTNTQNTTQPNTPYTNSTAPTTPTKPVTAPTVGATTIALTYPQAGNVLANNSAKSNNQIATIRWNEQNGKYPISLWLQNSNGQIVKAIATNIANTGSYVWVSDPSLPTGTYKIRIDVRYPSGASGQGSASSGYFTLQNQSPSITVTYPAGGEQLQYNTGKDVDLRVNWTTSNYSNAVNIYLVSSTGSQCLIGSTSSGNGTFPITIGAKFHCANGQPVPTSGQYKVEVSGADGLGDGKEVGSRSGNFMLSPAQNIKTAPTDPYQALVIIPLEATQKDQDDIARTCRLLGDKSQVLSIKQFGAIGDGKADEYDALRGAAAYMSQPEQIGKTLYFPPGTYKIDRFIDHNIIKAATTSVFLANIQYIGAKNIKIIGCKAVIDVKGDFHKRPLAAAHGVPGKWRSDLTQVTPFRFSNSSGFTLAGFEIKGNVGQMAKDVTKDGSIIDILEGDGRGVQTSGSSDYILEDLNIHDFSTDGMELGLGIGYKLDTNVTVRNVILRGNGRQALSIEQVRGATFTSDQFLDTGGGKYGGHSPRAGVDIEPIYCVSGCLAIRPLVPARNTGDILFDNCTFANNKGAQIVAGPNLGTENVTIKNSTLDGTESGNGIVLLLEVTNGIIDHDTFKARYWALLAKATGTNLTIHDSTFIDIKTVARNFLAPLVDIEGGATAVFTNNTISTMAISYNSTNKFGANLSGVISSSNNRFNTTLSGLAAEYFIVKYAPSTHVVSDSYAQPAHFKPNGLSVFANPYSQ